MHPQILPECFADTLLVEMLGFKPTHISGIGEVINTLSSHFNNRAAVGIIDNDKNKPNDFAKFTLEKEETGIQRRRKAKTKHTLLVICPAFEDWVWGNANAMGIDPAKYGFHNRKSFRNACKTENASANLELKQFLNTLKQKKSPGFQQLKKWICEGAGIDENDL